MIAYLDQLGTDDDEITESGNGGGHGLVLCLKNAASDVCWSTEDAYEFGESAKVDNFDSLKRSINVSGYTNTLTLAAKDGAETKYPAAWQARNYTGLPAPAGTTGWFLPSAQQWLKMLEGLGGLAEKDIRWGGFFDFNLTAAHKWNEAMKKAGTSGTDYDSMTDNYQWFWSSSEYSASLAIRLIVNDGSGFHWFWTGKDDPDDLLVRPVLAF